MKSRLTSFDKAASILIFLFFWGLYLYTLAPGILFEDTGEFALSLHYLGVSHPPGYPLYTLLGPLVNLLPFGSPAFCASILSAFLGALGVCAIYFACRSLRFSGAAAAPAAVACGVSFTIWSQAVISEVYTLKLLLDAVLLLVIGRMAAGRLRWIAAAGLVAGLTAANHYTSLAAFLPVLLLFAVSSARTRAVRVAGALAAGAVAMASALLLYASLPLRAAADPVFKWQNPESFTAFMQHIRRTQFEQWESQLGFHLPTVLNYFSDFFENLPKEFNVALLFAAVLGLALLLSSRWREAVSFLWLILVQSVGVMLIVRFHYNELGLSVVRVFYIGAYVVTGVLIAAGLDGIMKRAGESRLKAAAPLIPAAALAAALLPLGAGFAANNLSGDDRTEVFAEDVMRFLPRDAVLYLKGSHFNMPLMYVYETKNLRNDILMVDRTGNLKREILESLYNSTFEPEEIEMVIDDIYRKFDGRREQAFTTPRLFEGVEVGFSMKGPFYYRSEKQSCELMGWNPDTYGYKPGGKAGGDYENRQLWTFFMARRAECDFMNDDHDEAFKKLEKAADAMPGSANTMLFAGQLADRYNFRNIALRYYEKALELDPTFTDALLQLGQMMVQLQGQQAPEDRNFISAEEYFERALEVSPGNIHARLALANIAVQNRDFSTAEDYYKSLLDEYPDNVLIYNNLANLYIRMRRVNEASKLYETALAYDPESALTTLNYGSFLLDLGKTEKAMELLKKHIELLPGSSYGHYNLGLAFQKTGNYNNSVIHYRKAVEIEPKLVQAWTNLIGLLLDNGKYEAAVEAARESPEPVKQWQGMVNKLVSAGMQDRALEMLEESQGPPEAWAALIILNIRKGRVEAAGEALEKMKSGFAYSHPELVEELSAELEEARSALEPVGGSR